MSDMNEIFIRIKNIRIKVSSIISYTSQTINDNSSALKVKVLITDPHGVVSFDYSNPDDAFKLVAELDKLFVIKPL